MRLAVALFDFTVICLGLWGFVRLLVAAAFAINGSF